MRDCWDAGRWAAVAPWRPGNVLEVPNTPRATRREGKPDRLTGPEPARQPQIVSRVVQRRCC